MKRKNIIYLLEAILLLVVAAFVYSYFNQDRLPHDFGSTATTSLATTTVDTPTITSFATTTAYYEFSYDVPSDNAIVAQSIKTRANKWLTETNVAKITGDAQAERDFGIFEGAKYVYDSTFKTVYATDNISYVETVYEFTGGAHGATNNITHVFGKNNGKQVVSLTDIYSDSIYQVLSDYARKELPAQLAKKSINVKDTEDMFLDGTEPIKENWQSFYFKGESLVIIFGQYQIGPYVIGIHELEIPLKNLTKYRK